MLHSFAQNQFGKPIDQITPEDLVAYFSTERDESLTLEFKCFYQREGDIKYKENGVLRTICGFLNSNGGLLIWGAPIGTTNLSGQKVFTGDLSPVEKRYSKDDFISKISNRIIPFAAPVQVQPVEISLNKFVYLIDVPESEAKPHQFDNIYYMRLDGQTKPAPHYIIDALFKQVKQAQLDDITNFKVAFLRAKYSRVILMDTVDVIVEVSLLNLTHNINDQHIFYLLKVRNGGFKDSQISLDYTKPMVNNTDVTKILPYGIAATYKENFRFYITQDFIANPITTVEICYGGLHSKVQWHIYILIFNIILDTDDSVGEIELKRVYKDDLIVINGYTAEQIEEIRNKYLEK